MRASSFGAAAEQYERGRPSYPDQALEWLLPAGAERVLDLAAGTGKLTRTLSDRGLDVLAVDHSDQMLGQLTRVVRGARAVVGVAERLPLADGAVDAVLVAQAWHWVDIERAVPEVARVLRPGGQVGLVWNVRDERVDWVARLGRIMGSGGSDDFDTSAPPVGPPFAPIERSDVEWTHHLTREELVDLVASRSYVITLPAEEQQAVLAAVRELVDTHPALDPDHLALPYITRCSRARLAPRRDELAAPAAASHGFAPLKGPRR